jgi:hypothetical protein
VVCDAFKEELRKSPAKIYEQMKNYGPGKDIEESLKSLKSAKGPEGEAQEEQEEKQPEKKEAKEEKKPEADPHTKEDL